MTDNHKAKILVVDDEQAGLNAINRTLRNEFDLLMSLNCHSALEIVRTQEVAVVLADQRMPEMTGVELFERVLDIQPDTVRILITGYTDIEAIIQAINTGKIFYYLSKPWEPEELRLIIRRAVDNYRLVQENRRLIQELKRANELLLQENVILQEQAEKQYEFENIVGQSKSIQEVYQLIRKVIPTDTPILVFGETGTGKELIARAIHYNGPRKHKLFIAQNCAALPDTLLESELFGHTRGAFTGATQDKKGLFELADKGTIFLDEIADTSPAFQLKLLRVLQEGEIRPLGAEVNIRADVRIISATNRDLEALVKSGKFREDLYYRLNVFPIRVPPLRERREDIPLLVQHFIEKYRIKLNKKITGIDRAALNILAAASYSGNIRELENEIQRAMTLAEDGGTITAGLLSDKVHTGSSPLYNLPDQPETLKNITENLEKYVITETLKKNRGNITHTARELGLSRVGLQKKIQRYGLKKPQ